MSPSKDCFVYSTRFLIDHFVSWPPYAPANTQGLCCVYPCECFWWMIEWDRSWLAPAGNLHRNRLTDLKRTGKVRCLGRLHFHTAGKIDLAQIAKHIVFIMSCCSGSFLRKILAIGKELTAWSIFITLSNRPSEMECTNICLIRGRFAQVFLFFPNSNLCFVFEWI